MSEQSKILIAEISDNTVWYKYFPFYANVWGVRTNNIYTGLAHPDFELENIGLYSDLSVLSFQVRKVPYLKVATIAEVVNNHKTFYFNQTDKTLFIHFENHKPYYYWKTSDLEIGFAIGFYYSNTEVIGEWNETQYYNRLKATDLMGSKKDDLYFKKQVFPGKSIEIIDNDLRFKNFNIGYGIKKKNGNFVRILIWTGDDATNANYNDFNVDYQGTIEKITEGKSIKLNLRDIRASLINKSPVKYLDTANYTYIKDLDKEYLIPEVWGKCFDIPIQCLNENVNDAGGITAYEFMICDTEFHTLATNSIKTVYINGKKTSLTPTVLFNTTQGFAYFSIPAVANFAVNDGTSNRYENMDKVTIDIYGYLKGSLFKESDGLTTSSPTDLIENGLSILREIIKNNYGKDYSTTFFDITTWKTFEDTAYKIGFFNNKQKTIQKQIEELASWQLGTFLWNADLKFSFDNDDFTSYEDEVIKEKFLPMDFFPEFETDTTRTLATFRVGIKQKWNQKDKELKHEWLIDDSNEDTAITDFNSTHSEDFLTGINNEADGLAYAARILTIGGTSVDTFKIIVPWEYIDLKAGDWIKVQADHSIEELIGWTKCQIQEVKPIISKWNIQLTLRIFGYLKYLVRSGEFITRDQRKILVGV